MVVYCVVDMFSDLSIAQFPTRELAELHICSKLKNEWGYTIYIIEELDLNERNFKN